MSTGQPTGTQPARSSFVAVVWAGLNLAFASFLFRYIDAGPLSTVVLFGFPIAIGGLGIAGWRYSWRIWPSASAGRKAAVLLALLGHLVAIGLAVLIALLIIHGPIVA